MSRKYKIIFSEIIPLFIATLFGVFWCSGLWHRSSPSWLLLLFLILIQLAWLLGEKSYKLTRTDNTNEKGDFEPIGTVLAALTICGFLIENSVKRWEYINALGVVVAFILFILLLSRNKSWNNNYISLAISIISIIIVIVATHPVLNYDYYDKKIRDLDYYGESYQKEALYNNLESDNYFSDNYKDNLYRQLIEKIYNMNVVNSAQKGSRRPSVSISSPEYINKFWSTNIKYVVSYSDNANIKLKPEHIILCNFKADVTVENHNDIKKSEILLTNIKGFSGRHNILIGKGAATNAENELSLSLPNSLSFDYKYGYDVCIAIILILLMLCSNIYYIHKERKLHS